MKWLDHYLQHRREKLALKQVRPDDVILDFGCHNGHLFHDVELEFSSAIGIDNDSSQMLAWSQVSDDRVRFICGGVSVIESLPTQFKPTLIVSLAVMEHLDERSIAQFGWT
ncbi:MAG: class I SAM-dependent methyltransferase, partial [Actinobacteria bacterium]|nr:class I SAM-dependent methyltransferase [Actinomycetota bacterium]